MSDAVDLLKKSFDAAVAAADPLQMLAQHLPKMPRRALVVGAGKAAASMAVAVERAWPDTELDGLVITRYAHGLPTRCIRVIEAGHPVPDAAGEAAAAEILARASALQAGLKRVTRDLLASGAPIEQMNVVRKHLSRIAGGHLATAATARGATVVALIISDVTGDAPADIASGPCAADPSTYADATAVLRRWNVTPPASVADWLARGERGEIAETPKPGDARLAGVENRIVATARGSLQAAGEVFRRAGVTPVILGDTVTGEAREVAKVYAALVRELRAHDAPFARPVALISGGECTVTLPPGVRGRGGRCSEFLLSLAVELDGMPGVHALAADTDGIDGSEDNAGAWLAPETAARAAAAGMPARAALDAHDAYGFFAAGDNLVVTGPTRTNVNDYRVILVT